MKCARCGFDNPPESRFCGSCGQLLGVTCPHCGAENQVVGHYCTRCGQSLSASPAWQVGAAPIIATNYQYGGFWIRVVASLIDWAVLLLGFVGVQAVIQQVETTLAYLLLEAAYAVLFTTYLGGTLGKLILGYRVVTSQGFYPSLPRSIGRYFASYLSALPLALGFAWVGWDERKQGWHDKLAGTFVVRKSTLDILRQQTITSV